MALLLKLGFGYLLRDGLLDAEQSRKAQAFFRENFVFIDPTAPTGECYYQGRFLIRTRKAQDNMNVVLRFCPQPEALFVDTPWGRSLNPLAVTQTEVVDEEEADLLEQEGDNIDLVIRFKNIDAIINLIGRERVDMVGLLLENVVQLTGNVGHLFKLGALAKNIETELGLATVMPSQ